MPYKDLRHLLLFTAVIAGVIVTLNTELLSVLGLITPLWITMTWCLVLITAITLYVRRPTAPITISPPPKPLSRLEMILSLCITLIMLALLTIALLAPPNTWDSMTYHMSRVAHWIQNHSVDLYPTQDERQIWKDPWAEYAILHLQLLSRGDHFANLVQWLAFAGSIVGVTLIAQALGINRLGQIITALVAATMPMSLLQATSTQNDLAAALWLICFIVFTLAWKHKPDGINAFALAASLGLALLTKEINYVYALPLCAWFAWQGIRTHRGKFLTAFFWCAIIIVLLNGPHWWRNFTLYHHPFASTQTNQGFLIEHHGFSVLWSNLYLNIANHLSTPFPGIDHQTQAWLQWVHQHLFNCAIESSPANAGNFSLSHDALHEDHAGNFLHLLLIMASMIMLYLRFRSLEARTRAYLTAVIGVFFSYLWFMKWQPFNNRLEILIFLLWTPLIALSLKQMCNKKQLAIVLAFIVIGSMPWVFANYSRPLIGPKSVLTTPRTTQYFANLKDAPFSYIQTVKAIANDHCDQIGIALGEDAWEYPLWVLFHQQGKQLRIERILGANIAFKKLHYPLGAFNPCAIITTGDRTDATITFNNNVYIPTLHTAFLTVYSDLKWYLYQHPDIYEKMKP